MQPEGQVVTTAESRTRRSKEMNLYLFAFFAALIAVFLFIWLKVLEKYGG